MNRIALKTVFRQHFVRLKGHPVPPFRIELFPYSDLHHTIRLRGGRCLIRISDLLRDASQPVWSALLNLLLHRLFRQPVPAGDYRRYRDYVARTTIRQAALLARRLRGRKKEVRKCSGRVHPLGTIFAELNLQYFAGELRLCTLGWSRRGGRRVLGHFDPAQRAIVLNSNLDHPSIPRYVVEYVLYHEMLHAWFCQHEEEALGAGHPHRFRVAEESFPPYPQARAFLEDSACGRA